MAEFVAQTIIAGSKISFKAGGVPGTPATFAPGDVFGVVDKGSVSVETVKKELKGYKSGNPGVRVLVDSNITETTSRLKFTLEELTPLALQLGFAADSGGVIYAGSASIKGWIEYVIYNGASAVKTITAYGSINLDGDLSLGEEYTTPAFVFDILNGTVADPA